MQTIFVGDGSKSVQALVFDTSDFPYVVNVENRREVPVRVGAGTESAHRNQLVRMFEPSLRPPSLAFTECAVGVKWKDTPSVTVGDPSPGERVLTLDMQVYARVFVEHFGVQPTTLPIRDMRARFVSRDFVHRFDVKVRHLGDSGFASFVRAGEAMPPEPVPPQFGVYARDQHVIATAPGEFSIETSSRILRAIAPDSEIDALRNLLASAEDARVDLAARVVGVEQMIRFTALLSRSEPAETPFERRHARGETQFAQQLGPWELVTKDSDPWGE